VRVRLRNNGRPGRVGVAMTEPAKTGPKQARGRFKPGQSGNPAGRPAGSRHRVSLLVEQLIENEAEALTRAALTQAKAGDGALLKALLDRLAPPRRERPVQVDLPPLQSPQDAPEVAAALLVLAASGELTPSEAQGLAGLLESYRRQFELADIETRLRALEENANAKR
jgi:hypothetical protein